MRKTLSQQLGLVPEAIPHSHARELARASAILDLMPHAAELVAKDLGKGTKGSKAGRLGMTGEQVLRATLLKQMHGWSYTDLAFALADSPTFRSFCRIGFLDRAPKRSALAENIKRVRPETFEQVNRLVLGKAAETGIEKGRTVRIDSTVIESNIHHPMDSNLLYDVVRVLTRVLVTGANLCPSIRFHRHTKRAKRRMLAILNTRGMDRRVPLYRELLQVTRWTIQYATDAIVSLEKAADLRTWATADLLKHYIELGHKVISQTERRVFQKESVPAQDKIVSIFEPHTDIIVKDRRETLYGHKVFLNVGTSGMIIDLLLERGNPADATHAVTMLERQRRVMGRVAEQAVFDAGFTSTANVQAAMALGVKDAAFAKKGSIAVLEAVRSDKHHKKLQRFRAGVEGIISFAKRCFGFGRCMWRGYRSFRAYAWASVLATNVLLISRA
jgi:IS5 family transposase